MLYLIACAAAIVADQLLKRWIVLNVSLGSIRPFIPGLMSITYVKNYGAAFSILQNMRWLFIVTALIFVAAAVWVYLKKKVTSRFGLWAITAIVAGALGNAVDRLMTVYVVDMFSFDFMNFAIFNLADCFITVGVGLLCIYIFFLYEKKELKKLPAKGKTDEKTKD